MLLLDVLIQYTAHAVNRPFSYLYSGKKHVDIGYRVLVNFHNAKIVGYVVNIKNETRDKKQLEEQLGFDISQIIDVIDDSPLLNGELMKLSDEISSYYLAPKISVLQAMLPPSLKPTINSLKAPKIKYEHFVRALTSDEDGLTPKQIELLRLIKTNGQILKSDINSPSILKRLLELKKVELFDIEKSCLKVLDFEKEEKKILTLDQQSAVTSILNSDKMVSLLEGVTGSGKTEVYLSLAEETLKKGLDVLFLVPEISLTPIMVEYFSRRFDNKVAILHSELTPAEKYDEYRRIANGDCHIVVGARSAIFAPLKHIGLIILDEEHVESYKQENLPYYHAKEVALMRAKMNNAKVVLGSATPSLETRARAIKGAYNHVFLSHRINEQALPKTYIVDLLDSRNLSRESVMFSNLLIEKMKKTLSESHQVVILMNRRGYSTYLSCRSCGHTFKCPNCDLALTYHREDNLLKCHHCGHVELMPTICPECGSTHLAKNGFGTERIIDEIHKLFPNYKAIRLDSDVGKVKNNIAKTLSEFRSKKADILVGTQMVAKGHDFPNVTLVAVLLADIGLNMPSFRSSERTFQLITQAVGRSGRGDYAGEAVIQTYVPDHYAIKFAAKQDYNGFFNKEIEVRRIQQYPPYSFVLSISLSSSDESLVEKTINQLADDIIKQDFKDVQVLGPTTPFIPYENKSFCRDILIKYKSGKEIKNYLAKLAQSLASKTNIHISINVDTYGF